MNVHRTVSLSILGAVFLSLVVFLSPSVAAQTNPGNGTSVTTSLSTVSTGTNFPAPTGCTAPGYTAPASLITTLGQNKTENKFSVNPPRSDRPYEYLVLGGGIFLALLIVVGIIWAIAIVITRVARRNKKDAGAQVRKSHAARNAYLGLFLIALVATGSGLYVLSPYIGDHEVTDQTNGMVQNIASPLGTITLLAPYSINYYYVPAYVNNESTLLEGNFTVLSGANVQVVVIPDSLRSSWDADLSNGTFAGVTGCTMAGVSVYYDSGSVTSGSFAVLIPPVTNQTTYDVVFADSSAGQNVTMIANVYWAY